MDMAFIDGACDVFLGDVDRFHPIIIPSLPDSHKVCRDQVECSPWHILKYSSIPDSCNYLLPSDIASFAFIMRVIVSLTGTGTLLSLPSLTIAPLSASISSLLPAFKS